MIDEQRALEILQKPELKTGLRAYMYLMGRLHRTDVSADREFQTVFRSFYSDGFAAHYFRLLEQLKDVREMRFVMALERIKHIRNTYEMSFSSKMAHTIDPRFPIWDRIVTKQHFGISAPTAKRDREAACCKWYDAYRDQFSDYLASDEGKLLVRLFDAQYPDTGITDVKKLDFLLWLDR